MTSSSQRLKHNRQGRNLETVGSWSGLARWTSGRSTLASGRWNNVAPFMSGKMAYYVNSSAGSFVHPSEHSVTSERKACNNL
jgi:hypothetical protein